MKFAATLTILYLFSWSAIAQQDPSVDRMRKNGDTLQIAIPALALGAALLSQWDRPYAGSRWSALTGLDLPEQRRYGISPVSEFAYTFIGSQALTHTLKFALNAERPDGGDHSFPSAHTSAAFTGAEFIREQYGWQLGLPAYLAASYVGYSRIASDRHYGRDVLAGAVLGILANHVGPWNDESGRGQWLPQVGLTSNGNLGIGFEFRW